MIIEIDFDNGNAPWQIQNKLRCKQIDGHNCGPIACVIIMEIYGWLREGAVNKIANNKGGYRTVVMRYFSHVIEKYDNVLRAELRANVYSDDKKGYEDRVGDLVDASRTNNPVPVITNEDDVRKDVPSDPGRSIMQEFHQQLWIHVSSDPGRQVVKMPELEHGAMLMFLGCLAPEGIREGVWPPHAEKACGPYALAVGEPLGTLDVRQYSSEPGGDGCPV